MSHNPATPDDGGEKKAAMSERFWAKVRKTEGCWEWTSHRAGKGYGYFEKTPVGHRAHRVSWYLAHGPIPDGLCVLHRCDNRLCVRLDHLFLGTVRDNNHDLMLKGHHPCGPKVRPLSEGDVREIRSLNAEGVSARQIARQFGRDHSTILDIIHRHSWKDAA